MSALLNKSIWKSECKFVIGATSFNQIPNSLHVPEVAFVGRSNVGKSSLINALVGKNCAKISSQPGRTQQINFFSLNNRIMLVDLPGYGYAAVSKKTRELWDRIILDYLKFSLNIKRIFLLIDSRIGIKTLDIDVANLLDKLGLVYQIVLTKIDKISNLDEIILLIKDFIISHTAAHPILICTSSNTNIGLNDLRSEIELLIK